MSNEGEQSPELGAEHVINVVGGNTPHHEPLNAQKDAELHALGQQMYNNRTPGDTTEESDAAAIATDNNSPVQSDHEHDEHSVTTPTNAHNSRYNTRSTSRYRSARNPQAGSHSGVTSPADEYDSDDNAPNVDARIDDDEEFTVSTSKRVTKKISAKTTSEFEPTESSTVALALQEIRRKDWRLKAQVHHYREQLGAENGHYANMMDRLMDIYESPEPVSMDAHTDPTAVYVSRKKALRRIQTQRAELRDCQQHIDDVKSIWFLWIGVIPSNFKADEIEAREQFLAVEGSELFASVWRTYGAHRKRLDEEEEDAQIALEWAQKEIDHRRRLQEIQAAQKAHSNNQPRVPNAHSASVGTPAHVVTTTTSTTAAAPLFGSTTTPAAPPFGPSTTAAALLVCPPSTTAPTFVVASTTTSATAATWSAQATVSTTGKPTSHTDFTATTTAPRSNAGSFGGFATLSSGDYLSQRTTLGLNAINSVDALRSRPQDLFASGTGFRPAQRPQLTAVKPTEHGQLPTQERGPKSTTFQAPRDTTQKEKQNPQVQFAEHDEVIETTPRKNETGRTANSRSRAVSPRHRTAQSEPTDAQSARPDQTPSKHRSPTHTPSTELSSVVSALKQVMSRLTSIEDRLETAREVNPQPAPTPQTAHDANPTGAPTGKLNVGADGRTLPQGAPTAVNNDSNARPMPRDRADGAYVIPLPAPGAPDTTVPTSSAPAHTTPRMMAAYGMAAKDGSDFGDGIRVAAMDGRNLNPEIAVNSPVGPKPPTYQRTQHAGSTLPTGAPVMPTFAHSSIKVPEPKPFFGEFFDWPRFSSEWTNFVNSTMPNQFTLMTVLKKLLKGNAQTTAQRFDGHTTEEYDDLWQALCTRFHRPDQVVKHYLNTFSNIHPPTRESIPDLRQFHGEMCNAINKLKRASRDVS